MDIAATKLELMQQILSIVDEKTLIKIASFFRKEVPGVAEEDDDLSDEDIVEFDDAIARHESGEERFHTVEDSMRLVRAAHKPKA
jgi:hypothetical protein